MIRSTPKSATPDSTRRIVSGRADDKRGFTLVEAVIVAVVIAVILAVTIPWMRERERQRLQALADTEPWEVFELRAKPAKKTFAADEQVIIHCEIENMTDYPLSLPKDREGLALILGDSEFVAGLYAFDSQFSIPDGSIGPGDTIDFTVGISAVGVGASQMRVTYHFGDDLVRVVSQSGGGRVWTFSGKLRRTGNRFQSNQFHLVIEAEDNSVLQTFDEIVSSQRIDYSSWLTP
jgi:prepilin-type N-terminal cleavage/methylation domain-containing protein